MPNDIDWEAACNDFHPAFALVRGERYEPDAKPIRTRRRAPSPEPSRQSACGAPLTLLFLEHS